MGSEYGRECDLFRRKKEAPVHEELRFSMQGLPVMKTRFLFAFTLFCVQAHADPQLSSWYTAGSSKYARIVETDSALLSGATETTWSRNGINQTLPAYAGIQEIDYSSNWVYIKTPDLAPFIMGPWYNDGTRSALFVNIPKNQNLIIRIPRSSTLGSIPSTKTSTMGRMVNGSVEDTVGYLVDGVAMFDPTDGFSYANGTEASPGTGQWHRDAGKNEGPTMDTSMAHQQNTGKYHNHINPLALRYLLGDNVTFDNTYKTYAEASTTGTHKHSPILGWMHDGLPLYGPYGYAVAMDSTSTVKRMRGGFVLRDGATPGVDNLSTGSARALPAWALRNNGNVSAAGPDVSTTYPLGRYSEDYAYLGDLLKDGTNHYVLGDDFDLNEYNVRYCVTPEFPGGTWAYFLNIDSSGTAQFPYLINRWFYGTPTGSAVTSITETVTTQFTSGPNLVETAAMGSVVSSSGDATLVWTSAEGGTYEVDASTDLVNWTALTTTKAAATNAVQTSYTDTGAALANSRRFYKVTRKSLASYDTGATTIFNQGIATVSPPTGTHGGQVTLTITLNSSYNPAPPPNNVMPTNVTLTLGGTTVTAFSYSRDTNTGVVSASFNLPATPLGTYTVNAVFGPKTWSLTSGFTIN